MRRTAFALAVTFLLISSSSFGQTLPSAKPLPRGFIGFGGSLASGDQGQRMAGRIADSEAGLLWIVEAGASVTSRLGLGVEIGSVPEANAVTTGLFGVSRGRETERTVIGLVRGRMAGSTRIAFDLLAGAGFVFQRYEAYSMPCITGCAETLRATLNRRSTMFALGAEGPIRLSRHVVVSPFVRLHLLRRGKSSDVRWQFEYESSDRVMAGVSGRLVF